MGVLDHSRKKLFLDSSRLTLDQVVSVARSGYQVELRETQEYVDFINSGHRFLMRSLEAGVPVYGVSTGFGDSCRFNVSQTDMRNLQSNLIKYHLCGTGPPFPEEAVISTMLIRLNSNSQGYSGIRYLLLKALKDLINNRIIPVIPSQGSVGASGDLTPLAYIAAALTGTGRVYAETGVTDAAIALQAANLEPVVLEPKEGLALINGTSVMTALATLAVYDSRRLAEIAERSTALCIEALYGSKIPFEPRIHELKSHPGQIISARNIFSYLKGSRLALNQDELIQRLKSESKQNKCDVQLQDPYSVRCAPQVIGVLRDVLEWTDRITTTEINSVNDNPIIDPLQEKIYNGGNFYGGHIAQAMDSLKPALANVADLLDRQIALLVDSRFNRGLPHNLIPSHEQGSTDFSHHGFKGLQITASALAAEALKTAAPISAFSRSTECHNQDKVSMGTIAAREAAAILELCRKTASIHAMISCQATELRNRRLLSAESTKFFEKIRSTVPFLDKDRPLDEDMEKLKDQLFHTEDNDFFISG